MIRKPLVLTTLILLTSLAAAAAPPTCVNFEAPLVAGTVYGAPAGQNSGDVAFISNGITVRVFKFVWTTSGTIFNLARVEVPPVPFASGQSVRSNNINLDFYTGALSPIPKTMQISFLDLGGYENLKVNNSSIYVGELTSAPATLGGASIGVSWTPLPPPSSGKKGVVTIKGVPLQEVWLGGQELWLDDVCVF